MSLRSPRMAAVALICVSVGASACSGDEEPKYEAKKSPSGVTASLPPAPNLPQRPLKVGDAYTVWGASYYLRSRVHHKEINGQRVSLIGYISKTNLPDAPECAVHKTGKEDPQGCTPPVPTFWLCDAKDAPDKECMKVMGWASNFAQLFDAVEKYHKNEKTKKGGGKVSDKDAEPMVDNFWSVKIPDPIPGKGAKVTVKGTYSTTFTRATSGVESDPIMGVMTFDEMTYLEPPPEEATLPGMKLN